MAAALFLVLAIAISSFFVVGIQFQPDDEMVLSYLAYHSFSAHQNPYLQNYRVNLTSNLSTIGEFGTLLNNGTAEATFDYPIGFLLVQVPFFVAFNPSPYELGRLVMPTEYIVFFAIFILALYLLMKENPSKKPIYSAIPLGAIVFLVFSSTLILLILGLALLLYTKQGSRWSWLILGVMASIQQLSWPFVLFYLAYQSKTQGFKVFILPVVVFLVINGVFIIANPQGFINAFVILGNLRPDTIAPIGGIVALVPQLGWFMLLLTVLSIGFLFEYIRIRSVNPIWLPLFSAIPFIFFAHSLPVYYALPFAIFAILEFGKSEWEI